MFEIISSKAGTVTSLEKKKQEKAIVLVFFSPGSHFLEKGVLDVAVKCAVGAVH